MIEQYQRQTLQQLEVENVIVYNFDMTNEHCYFENIVENLRWTVISRHIPYTGGLIRIKI